MNQHAASISSSSTSDGSLSLVTESEGFVQSLEGINLTTSVQKNASLQSLSLLAKTYLVVENE